MKPYETNKDSSKVPVLITTDKAGVFFGYVDKDYRMPEVLKKDELPTVSVTGQRMCFFWVAATEAEGVLGLATVGPQKGSKITGYTKERDNGKLAQIPHVTMIREVTEEAEANWLKYTEWK